MTYTMKKRGRTRTDLDNHKRMLELLKHTQATEGRGLTLAIELTQLAVDELEAELG